MSLYSIVDTTSEIKDYLQILEDNSRASSNKQDYPFCHPSIVCIQQVPFERSFKDGRLIADSSSQSDSPIINEKDISISTPRKDTSHEIPGPKLLGGIFGKQQVFVDQFDQFPTQPRRTSSSVNKVNQSQTRSPSEIPDSCKVVTLFNDPRPKISISKEEVTSEGIHTIIQQPIGYLFLVAYSQIY